MAVWGQYESAKSGKCFSCRKPMRTIIRMAGKGKISQNETKICQQKNCRLFIDLEKLSNWKPKETSGNI